jgi:hypothetical protein
MSFDRYAGAQLLRLLAALFLLLAVLNFFRPQLVAFVDVGSQGAEGLAAMLDPPKGFMVQALSEPGGARIEIDGRDRGFTPFLGNVSCREGEDVVLTVRAPGYQPWQRKVACREDGQLEIKAQLEP